MKPEAINLRPLQVRETTVDFNCNWNSDQLRIPIKTSISYSFLNWVRRGRPTQKRAGVRPRALKLFCVKGFWILFAFQKVSRQSTR
jgi:hypothetical protein